MPSLFISKRRTLSQHSTTVALSAAQKIPGNRMHVTTALITFITSKLTLSNSELKPEVRFIFGLMKIPKLCVLLGPFRVAVYQYIRITSIFITRNQFFGCYCGMCKVYKWFIGRVNPLTELPETRTLGSIYLLSSAVSRIGAGHCMIKVQLSQQTHNRHGVDPVDRVVVVAILERQSSEVSSMFQLQLFKHLLKTHWRNTDI